MTYRVGNHHRVTIIDENPNVRCLDEDHDCTRGHLVAVVIDGEREFAERICALLNRDEQHHPSPPYPPFCSCGFCGPGHTPDATYARGTAEALALVADRIAERAECFTVPALGTLRDILEATAAELGVDEKAPTRPLSATEAAEQPSAGGSGCTEAPGGSQPPHATCVGVTTIGKPPGSEWVCGAGCPREPERKADQT